jgi:hypothetical protein
MQRLTEAASTRSLRRRLKTIRRKIEVVEHDLAVAQGHSPSGPNLFGREYPDPGARHGEPPRSPQRRASLARGPDSGWMMRSAPTSCLPAQRTLLV